MKKETSKHLTVGAVFAPTEVALLDEYVSHLRRSTNGRVTRSSALRAAMLDLIAKTQISTT